MKADYVVNVARLRPGLDPARRRRASCAACPTSSRSRASAAAQAKIEGSVELLIAADPTKIDSLFDLQPTQGKISDLSAERDRGARHDRQRQRPGSSGDTVPVEFPADRQADSSRSSRSTSRPGFANYVITSTPTRRTCADQFDIQIYVKTDGWRHPGEHRRDQEGRASSTPARSSQTRDEFKATQAGQINQFLNLIYVLLFFAIVIALFGIANTLGLSIIERTPRARAAARGRA